MPAPVCGAPRPTTISSIHSVTSPKLVARLDLDQEACRPGVLVHAVATVGESRMLTYKDCLKLCGLTAEEIAAIARHEHLPEIVAL